MEINGNSRDSERQLETHEKNVDSLDSERLMETNGDSWESERPMGTHETQRLLETRETN